MALSKLENILLGKKTIPTYVVDSFTDQPFKGNPAGVCLLKERKLSSKEMLQIAQELGHSETAFISFIENEENKSNSFTIRYFSPKMEIPLCGHATLAAAKVIFEHYGEENETELHFSNIQNLDLIARKEDDDMISMIFPSYSTTEATVSTETLNALGIAKPLDARYNEETKILMLEITDSERLAQLSPDYTSLVKSIDTVNGILVTAVSDGQEYDFHSRYFWPWSGTNEDPVTGGTHTFLTPYWSTKLGKKKMKSFQSSARSGWLYVELLDNEQIKIMSQAKIILSGILEL